VGQVGLLQAGAVANDKTTFSPMYALEFGQTLDADSSPRVESS
jgi:hypothetical protein